MASKNAVAATSTLSFHTQKPIMLIFKIDKSNLEYSGASPKPVQAMILADRRYTFATTAERKVVRDIKEHPCGYERRIGSR
jgi:hypothetical protein